MINNNNYHTIPKPTAARVELPTLQAVRALDLSMTLAEARLVLTCLSYMIGDGRSKSREKVAQMRRGVVACCRVDGFRDGAPVPAAHPELSEFGWPAGATALRRLRIDHLQLEQYWRLAYRRSTDACLPVDWVLAFVPAELWPAVLTIIGWGPSEAAMRLEDAVVAWAEQPLAVKTRRRDEDATVSAGTINTRVTGLHNLFTMLVKLRERALASPDPGLPLDLLQPWVTKPERPDVEFCGARWADVDTAGPSLEQLQGLLHRLNEDVISAPKRSRYWRLRRRVMAGLLAVHGQRIDAIHDLNVEDYRPAHNFGDGVIGPALAYRPAKNKRPDYIHILACPRELADWIEEWIRYTGRELGDASPLWPHRKPKPDQRIERINDSAFARLVSGHRAKDGTGSIPLLVRGVDPYHGYNPHSYRHTCYQAMRRAAARIKRDQPDLYDEPGSGDFARSVVGHDLIRDVGDLYRDINQQHLARVAIEVAWIELRTRPAVVAADLPSIDEACQRLELLNGTLANLAGELAAHEQRQMEIKQALRAMSGDELEAARIESNSLVFELARLQAAIATVRSRIDEARTELQHALTAEIQVEQLDPDYEGQIGAFRVRAEAALTNDPLTNNDQVTVSELSGIVGTTPKTINGWIRNGFPARRSALWHGDAWTTDSRGIRVLPLRFLNQRGLRAIQRERLLIVQLRHASKSQLRAA